MPKWYKFLKDNLVLSPHNLQLNLELHTPTYQNPLITHPKIPKTSNSHIKCPNTWIINWLHTISNNIYGKILYKTYFNGCQPMAYIEHWIFDQQFDQTLSQTPKSCKQTIIPYQGCKLHNTYYIGDMRPKCVLWLPLNMLINIHIQKYLHHNIIANPNKGIKRILLQKANSTLQQSLVFNDYLA
jgi:hypothetical protein